MFRWILLFIFVIPLASAYTISDSHQNITVYTDYGTGIASNSYQNISLAVNNVGVFKSTGNLNLTIPIFRSVSKITTTSITATSISSGGGGQILPSLVCPAYSRVVDGDCVCYPGFQPSQGQCVLNLPASIESAGISKPLQFLALILVISVSFWLFWRSRDEEQKEKIKQKFKKRKNMDNDRLMQHEP